MGRAESDPLPVASGTRTVTFTDADGRATDDPAAAVRGEVMEVDAHGRSRRRASFFLTQRELSWLPVSEPAFLMWVLALLMLVWIGIGLFLILT